MDVPEPTGRLRGQRALVTMADRYTGPAVVKRFTEEGATVIADVGRYREALRRGFVPIPGSVGQNNGPLVPNTVAACTLSDEKLYPAGRARDNFPLNCITWAAARAVCKFFDSDLPDEEIVAPVIVSRPVPLEVREMLPPLPA